jgi:hypothetical protein
MDIERDFMIYALLLYVWRFFVRSKQDKEQELKYTIKR